MKKNQELTTKFFMAMKMTEIVGCTADAVSTCHSAIAWNLDEGTIILNFSERCVEITDMGLPREMVADIIEDIADTYNFDFAIINEDGACLCDVCKEERSKHN